MLKKITLSGQAYNELSKRIIDGRLPAGMRLTEEALCSTLGISRTPLRDALLQLEKDGLVEPLPRKGCRVKAFDAKAFAELFECRAMAEEQALLLGFSSLNMNKLKKLRMRLNTEVPEEEKRRISFEVDSALHRLILECCPNRYLADFLMSLNRQSAVFRHYRTIGEGVDVESVTQERREILDAILSGDRIGGGTLLKAHILRGAKQLRNHYV